jgi:transcriptional regulator NrdR family protein
MSGDMADAPRPNPRGLCCPRCGCYDLRRAYTRKQPRRIMRVRTCRHCGKRIVTYEAVSGARPEEKRPSG